MAKTTPNKETVRRICLLQGATESYLFVDTGDEQVDVLTNISDENIPACVQELEAWCGMIFRVYNFNSSSKPIKKITLRGEKILPIKF